MKSTTYQDWKYLQDHFTPKSNLQFKVLYDHDSISLQVLPRPVAHLGGKGITTRTLNDISDVLPGVQKRIQRERGKIGILGNGFSEAAIDLAIQYQQGQFSSPPQVVDLFDYYEAFDDFRQLYHLCSRLHIWFCGKNILDTLQQICYYIEEGALEQVMYTVGSGNTPNTLQQFNLLINSHGPPLSTLSEQISMLAVGGHLYANLQWYHQDPIPFTNDRFQVKDNTKGVHHAGFKSYIFERAQ